MTQILIIDKSVINRFNTIQRNMLSTKPIRLFADNSFLKKVSGWEINLCMTIYILGLAFADFPSMDMQIKHIRIGWARKFASKDNNEKYVYAGLNCWNSMKFIWRHNNNKHFVIFILSILMKKKWTYKIVWIILVSKFKPSLTIS
jgi:hypothetical protein